MEINDENWENWLFKDREKLSEHLRKKYPEIHGKHPSFNDIEHLEKCLLLDVKNVEVIGDIDFFS